jgi:hypothetical protein
MQEIAALAPRFAVRGEMRNKMVYTEKKRKKSGAIHKNAFQFKITDVPFSRKFSYLYMDEGVCPCETGAERKQLRLNRTMRKYPEGTKAPALMAIRPMAEDRSVPYTCAVTPSMLEINTEYGYAQVCFDQKDLIRIRGTGIRLRFFLRFNPHEALVPRLDGTVQASFDAAGEFLFVPLEGALDYESEWDWQHARSEDTVLDIVPPGQGGFELAIHFADANTERLTKYRAFEDCVGDAGRDYANWLAMYPPVPGKYEDTKKLCAYAIWICYASPLGILKNNIVLFSKDNSALSWHQAYHAMAITKDADTAVQIMGSIFEYQDAYGELPDLIDDQYLNILATKPPFQGFAFLYMLERMGDRITAEHCAALYGPFARWYEWWRTMRDTDGDGVPQYNQGCESGNDYTEMLAKGTPVECPDLMAYLILLAESLEKLALRLGKRAEAAVWRARASHMLGHLLDEFWDGEKFIARLSGSHEIVEAEEIDCYMPLMLGKRLPPEIVEKLAERLADPELYYSEIGLRGLPRRYKDGKPQPGLVMAFAQVKLAMGLYAAGKTELARDILRRFLDVNAKQLPNFACWEWLEPGMEGLAFGKCAALSCSIFMAMAGFLAEISREDARGGAPRAMPAGDAPGDAPGDARGKEGM